MIIVKRKWNQEESTSKPRSLKINNLTLYFDMTVSFHFPARVPIYHYIVRAVFSDNLSLTWLLGNLAVLEGLK
jgi:hypothetical protein